MKDLFRRGLLVGLGVAEFMRETLSNAIAEMEKRGEVSGGEAKKIMDSFARIAEKRRKDLERTVEKALSGVLGRMRIPTVGRVEEMEKRLRAVERKLKARRRK